MLVGTRGIPMYADPSAERRIPRGRFAFADLIGYRFSIIQTDEAGFKGSLSVLDAGIADSYESVETARGAFVTDEVVSFRGSAVTLHTFGAERIEP